MEVQNDEQFMVKLSKKQKEMVRASSPVPTSPHMPPKESRFLAKQLSKARCFLEFGSGGSTVEAARAGVKKVFSVDSDAVFLATILAYIRSRYPRCDLKVFPVDLGHTRKWGYPTTKDAAPRWSDYFMAPWKTMHEIGASPDLVLIDGRFRVACFLATLVMADSGTKIIFDDYQRRSRYHRVEEFVRPSRNVGRLAVFRVPRRLDPKQIVPELLASIRDPR
jgi:hypothetical protein